jgi:hypothetical protein
MVNPLKVEVIVNLSPPCTIIQLQCSQGKEFFLRIFIANYAEITKGFMNLLNKGVPFVWDDQAQNSFDALNNSMMSIPLLSPPDYYWDILFYRVTSKSTIRVALIQKYDG